MLWLLVGLRILLVLSNRIRAQSNADDTQLDRATLLAQRRTDIYSPGMKVNRKLSFLAVLDEIIAATAHKLGVSLGTNNSEIEMSINKLKNVEETRVITFLTKPLVNVEEGEDNNTILATATNLSEDLGIEDNEPPLDQMGPATEILPCKITRRKKAGTGLDVKRRSARLQKIKSGKQ